MINFLSKQFDDDPLGEDQIRVFQDFEESRIHRMRKAIAERPIAISLIYLAMCSLWTAVISMGAAYHGPYYFSINLSPHVAMFSIALGVMIYPARLMWVPLGVLTLTFIQVMWMPMPGVVAWHSFPEMTNVIGLVGMVLNLCLGAAMGISGRLMWNYLLSKMRVHEADLYLSVYMFFIFIVIGYSGLFISNYLAGFLDHATRIKLGFDQHYFEVAGNRVLRGGAVVYAFLLLFLERFSRRDVLIGSIIVLAFPALLIANQFGIGWNRMMDAMILALVFALLLPITLAVFSSIVGLIVFAALSGEFLNELPAASEAEGMLVRYGIVGLFFVCLSLSLRIRTRHVVEDKASSIRRLNAVRDFAGVGLYAANLTTRIVKFDAAAQRLVNVGPVENLDEIFRKFPPEYLEHLNGIFSQKFNDASTMLVNLPMTEGMSVQPVVRLYFWFEISPNNEYIVYGLVVDVTDEYAQENALKNAMAELSFRQEKQRQMFSIISHELRTPASVLSMLIDDIDDGNMRLKSQMREASDQLLGVLADMRQAVNPEKNQPLRFTQFVPTQLLETVRNSHQMQANAAGISIRLELPAVAGRAHIGDEMRIKQVIGNLVRNAVIHSKCDEIVLGFAEGGKNGTYVFTVEDNGIGIAPEEIDRLFEPFERGSNDPRTQADGSGLGLFIVKTSVELMGGTIDYHCSPMGGAGYRIELPEGQSDAAVAAAPVAATPITNLTSLRVLLAEDNPLVAEVTLARLRKSFASVQHAQNGRIALQMIQEEMPDVLITDLFMPEMGGDELTLQLRNDGVTIPIIGLTAAVVGDDTLRFEQAGATAIMAKPLNLDELTKILSGAKE